MAVLTGAGISKPSGIPTFRDAEGLWKNFNPLDYATPEAYARDPEKVWAWYAWRIQKVREAKPNPAHYALVELERRILSRGEASSSSPRTWTAFTPSREARTWWSSTATSSGPGARPAGSGFPCRRPSPPPPFCPACGHRARPDVVWFGEFLPEGAWERAERAFAEADFALVVGTSAEVEPAASLGRIAFASGAYLVEVNPEPTPSPPGPPLLADGGGGGDGATPPSFPGRPGGRAPLLGPGPRRCGFSGSSQRPG